MTEQDLYIHLIPYIAKIAVQCREMDEEKYTEWKKGILTSTPDDVRDFVQKVMVVVDKVRKKDALHYIHNRQNEVHKRIRELYYEG